MNADPIHPRGITGFDGSIDNKFWKSTKDVAALAFFGSLALTVSEGFELAQQIKHGYYHFCSMPHERDSDPEDCSFPYYFRT